VAWAQGDAAEAETAFGDANALDNQSAVTWGWLAYVCLCAEPVRDREGAAALDQGLRMVSTLNTALDGMRSLLSHALYLSLFTLQGLCGDNTEATVLLHSLADRYRALGQGQVAVGLLRRAVVRQASPISGAALDAALRARIGLGECLAGAGSLEESVAQYVSVACAHATMPGEILPLSLKDSLRQSKVTAAAAAATLYGKLGKPGEADRMRVLYGGSGRPGSRQSAQGQGKGVLTA
jgi:hypothetical protein